MNLLENPFNDSNQLLEDVNFMDDNDSQNYYQSHNYAYGNSINPVYNTGYYGHYPLQEYDYKTPKNNQSFWILIGVIVLTAIGYYVWLKFYRNLNTEN